MKLNSVAEADERTDEMSGNVATPSRGVRPRPIRKRGFHRALKRGEPWAHNEKGMREMMNSIMKMYLPILEDQLKAPPMTGLQAFLKFKVDKP